MSTHASNIDQENRLDVSTASTKSVGAENSFKSGISKTTRPNSRLSRIPLGGKQQNSSNNIHNLRAKSGSRVAVPSLNKSFSTLASNKNPLRPPSLLKSNSSLGFIHKDDIASSLPKQNAKLILQKLNNDWLGQKNAARSASLIQKNLVSDSLPKKTTAPLEPSASLKDTVFPSSLHSSRIVSHDINKFNVDPQKRAHLPTQDTFNEFFKLDKIKVPQHLIDDPNSVEIVPQREPPLPYHPHDLLPLSRAELQSFGTSSGSAPSFEKELKVEDVQFDIDLSDDESREIENLKGNLGLSVDELHDLLD